MNKPFFSIVIPTYEMHGHGVEFLEYNLEKIFIQSFKDFEVIVSDHSQKNDIEELCKNYNVKYIRNNELRGSSSANLNNAIKNATGEWIKVIFQDDFLYNINSLKKIHQFIIDSSPKWVVTSCQHSNDGYNLYNEFHPRWNDEIYLGNNTLSSPSVLSFKNEDLLLFDESLIWMMDVDFYQRMYEKYGEPSFLHEVTVVNRIWGNRLSDTIPQEIKNKEEGIVKNKYKKDIVPNEAEQIFKKFVNLDFDHHTKYVRGVVDINEHLVTLRKYASKCGHVTEMGTRFAVSTLAFIIGKPKKFVAIDLNYHFFQPYEKEVKNFAKLCETEFEFVEGDVLKMDIEQTDFLFIDTLHTYNQLSKELRKHESKVNKWIALHDTVTFGYRDEDFYTNGKISEDVIGDKIEKSGLYVALLDFLGENKNWKIKEHFTNNNGLTIIERIC